MWSSDLIGFILGPLLGGWIAHITGSAAAPFLVAGMMGIANIVFISLFLPETRKDKTARRAFTFFKGIHNIRAALRDVDARPVYISSFLYISGFSFFISFIGILLVSRFSLSEASLGTFFGAVGAWIVITQLFILRILSKKYSERAILRWSLLVLAGTLAVYPFAPSVVFVYVLIPFLAIPNGLSMANMSALVSKSVSPDKQGAALGINGSLMAFSQGMIPLVAGVGSGVLGIQAPFIAGAALVVAARAVLFARKRK